MHICHINSCVKHPLPAAGSPSCSGSRQKNWLFLPGTEMSPVQGAHYTKLINFMFICSVVFACLLLVLQKKTVLSAGSSWWGVHEGRRGVKWRWGANPLAVAFTDIHWWAKVPEACWQETDPNNMIHNSKHFQTICCEVSWPGCCANVRAATCRGRCAVVFRRVCWFVWWFSCFFLRCVEDCWRSCLFRIWTRCRRYRSIGNQLPLISFMRLLPDFWQSVHRLTAEVAWTLVSL